MADLPYSPQAFTLTYLSTVYDKWYDVPAFPRPGISDGRTRTCAQARSMHRGSSPDHGVLVRAFFSPLAFFFLDFALCRGDFLKHAACNQVSPPVQFPAVFSNPPQVSKSSL